MLSVQKSRCRKSHEIGTGKRAGVEGPINSETNVREVVWSAGGRSTHNNQTPQKTALLSEVNLCIDIQSMRDTLAEKVKSKNGVNP